MSRRGSSGEWLPDVGSAPETPRGSTEPFYWFSRLLLIALAGYLFFGRSFAYLRLPGTPVYVAEAVLAVGICEALRVPKAVRKAILSSPLLMLLAVLLAAAALRLAWDVPEYTVDAVRDAALVYYGLFTVLVTAAFVASRDFGRRLLGGYRAVLPWFLLWAPVASVLDRLHAPWIPNVPGSDIPINDFKPGDIAVHAAIGIAYLWLLDLPDDSTLRRLRPVLTALGVLAIGAGGSQTRGGLIASIALLAVAFALNPARRDAVLTLVVSGALALGLFLISGVEMNVDDTASGRAFSPQQLAKNLASIVGYGEHDEELQGPTQWRLEYWETIATDTLGSHHAVVGHGFGPVLSTRFGFETGHADNPRPLRSAHNSHMTVFARLGIPGLALWVALLGLAIATLWTRSRTSGGSLPPSDQLSVWVLASLIGIVVSAMFDQVLEGPQVGVWFWTFMGLASVQGLRMQVPAVSLRTEAVAAG